MPRTGGVYSPPAGTKGVPNTTIQSVPYNTLIDDLTADANAPRPVTAGGTGATSASGARTALGVEIGSNVQAYDAALQSIAGQTTVANQILYTTATDAYATTALTPLARDLVGDATAAAMKTRLGFATVASSGSASDLTTGTLSDARLPGTMAGKNFSSNVQITGSLAIVGGSSGTFTSYFQVTPSDFGGGKPGLFINRDTATTYRISTYDGVGNTGTINIASGTINLQAATTVNNSLTVVGNAFSPNFIAANSLQ